MTQKVFVWTCLITLGSVIITTATSFILYFSYKTKALLNYSIYSAAAVILLVYRAYIESCSIPNDHPLLWLNEPLQLLTYIAYIYFLVESIELKPNEYIIKKMYRFSLAYLFIFLISTLIFYYKPINEGYLFVGYIISRFFLLIIGMIFVVIIIFRRKSVFHRLLLLGAAIVIVFGVLSFITDIFKFTILNYIGMGFIILGFFVDNIFFSTALGYRIKKDIIELENSRIEKLSLNYQLKEQSKFKEIEQNRLRDEERIRIARDLHDEMGSQLSSIYLYSQVAQKHINNDNNMATELLKKMEGITQKTMDQTNDLIWSLQTSSQNRLNINDKIQFYSKDLFHTKDINLKEQLLPNEFYEITTFLFQKNLWLIYKELCNNIIKHSEAKNVDINFEYDGNYFTLIITDDGIGCVTKNSVGNGIKNIKFRTEALNGTYEMKRNENITISKVQIPIPNFSY